MIYQGLGPSKIEATVKLSAYLLTTFSSILVSTHALAELNFNGQKLLLNLSNC